MPTILLIVFQFAIVNTVHTTIIDAFPHIFHKARQRSFLMVFLCTLCFFAGLACTTRVRRRNKVGDRLVIVFPQANMLTFTSAVGKLNLRVSCQHHTCLHFTSQSHCQVFVKSCSFVFEKINNEYAPHQKWQKSRRFCIQ